MAEEIWYLTPRLDAFACRADSETTVVGEIFGCSLENWQRLLDYYSPRRCCADTGSPDDEQAVGLEVRTVIGFCSLVAVGGSGSWP